MEKIGIFNLAVEDAKCNPEVRNAIIAKAKASARWNDVPGNHRHYRSIESVFNKVLEGGTLEEVRAVFKATQPPASLSQVGLIFPTEIWHSLGRGEQIEAVNEDGELVDRIEWELAHNMAEPPKDKVVTAWVATCMSCGQEHTVRELTSTLYCEACKPKYKKGKKAGLNVDLIKSNIKRLAQAASQRYSDNPEMQQQIGDRIDVERAKMGLPAMSPKMRKADPKTWMI